MGTLVMYGKPLYLPLNAVEPILRDSVDLLARKKRHSNGAGQSCPPKLADAMCRCYGQARRGELGASIRAPLESERALWQNGLAGVTFLGLLIDSVSPRGGRRYPKLTLSSPLISDRALSSLAKCNLRSKGPGER